MKVLNIAATILLAAILGFGLNVDLEAKSCKSLRVYGRGKSASKAAATAEAHSNWRKKARSRHGAPWAIWNNAKAKEAKCKLKKGKYHCSVRAYPCNS